MSVQHYTSATAPPRHGLARVLSKLGVCSRTQAAAWIRAGRVQVNGHVVRNPEHPIVHARDRLLLDGQALRSGARVYVMLNKPRGLVTSVSDEQGRDTIYRCLDDPTLPWLGPVGRLDKASEGLLLLSNDPQWAAGITDPERGPGKTYHVQVDAIPDDELLARLRAGIAIAGERLRVVAAQRLRVGSRNAWLEIVLDEGRNRHIRRLLAACDLRVLRLLRVAIGALTLGNLGKGCWRHLDATEVAMLAPAVGDRRRGSPD